MRVAVVLVVLVACGGDSGDSDCRDGEQRACYRGPADTRGIGACTDGVELCASGRWSGTCVGDVTPFVERCNGADDDCNGTVDDAETTGDTCTSSDGCAGAKACVGTVITCVSPDKNECGACGGPSVPGLGSACENEVCPGVLVCAADDASAVCNAPDQNACELCGGPPISDLDTDCTGASGCAGARVCNLSGTSTVRSCNPYPGECRDGGVLRAVVAPAVGDLVITEVMPRPAAVGATVGEWFEVQVMRDVDLNQVALDRAGDTNAPNVIESVDCLRVTAGSTLVFARNADPAMNGGLPAVTATFTFSLVDSGGDARLLLDAVVLDAVTWPASASGRARQLDPDLVDPAANDSSSNFCDATTPYGTGSPQDQGTPGAANVQCPLLPSPGSCIENAAARPIVKPAVGQLQITEVLPNPAGSQDTTREWFEIANTGGTAFDLNELVIADANDVSTIAVASCVSIAPGGLGLVARSNDGAANGMLPAPDATFSFSLVDSTGTVEVRDGTTVLDAITWTSVQSGVARALDPDSFTAASNDNASAAPWCAATAPYGDGTNAGTPRGPNPQCP